MSSGSQTPEEVAASDPFDALLREAARPSEPGPSRGRALTPGSVLAGERLRVVKKLGEGGMGVVYEALDQQRRERVALKILSRLDAWSVYRLKNEFRALADVTHPHLVALHELFADGESWFFTMELVAGERFDRWVRPRADARDKAGMLDEARLRAALPQLVAAICAIHAAGKLHRDLKPSNVLVAAGADGAGHVKVLDFGLAVDPELGGVGQTLADDGVSGTPAYMAPEQAAGGVATAASDVYALGVMLFEALTGELPFGGRTGEILAAKQRDDAPRASAVAADVPADLDALCAELLAREPGARPSAEALRARVHVETAHGTGSGSRSGGPTPSGSGERRETLPAAPQLFGRDAELSALRDAFAATLAGRSVVLFVSGESGMGKSALCEAFAHGLRSEGRATVLQGRCYERENVPFKGFDALVDDLSRHLRRLTREEATALLPREVYALARIFPVLERIAVVAEAPKKEVPDPQDVKRRAFDAFGELLGRMRDRAPLVVVLDDAQWLDQDSVRFMRALLVHPEPVPALLVCAHRSEGAADNALLQAVRQGAHDNPKLDVRELSVGPLSGAALRALTERLLPGDAGVQVLDALADEAQGSPFFAGELARAALVRGLGEAPPSLSEALSLHVEALPAGARRLLSLLALVGQPLSVAVAIDAAGIDDGHGSLDRLRHEQLVRVSTHARGERAVECYHDKIREQLAAALPPLHARELALGLSRALEARQDAGNADAELLSRVLELAGLADEAAHYAALAAEQALSALAFDRAAALYARALKHGRFEAERMQQLRMGHAEALALAGRPARAAEAFVEAAEHAPQSERNALDFIIAEQFLLCGDLLRGRERLDRMLRTVGHRLPQSLPGALASVAWSRARLRLRGLHFTERTGQDPATMRELEALQLAVETFARTDQMRGFDLSARYVRRALDAGHVVAAARALGAEVMFGALAGLPEAYCEEVRTLAAALCQRTNDASAIERLRFVNGLDNVIRRGRPEAALADFEEFEAQSMAHPTRTSICDRAWGQANRAMCLFHMGRPVDGAEVAATHLEDALARGDRTVSPSLAASLCSGLLAQGRVEHAHRTVAECQALLRPGEVTYQHVVWLLTSWQVDVYAERALAGWHETAALRERFLSSMQGRMFAGMMLALAAGMALVAMRQASDAAARRELERTVRRLLGLARRQREQGFILVDTAAATACLEGDRPRAIAALRARLTKSQGPMLDTLLRRRLGELLANDEGVALIAEADVLLRAGGVVDPARFTAAFTPGQEIV